MRRSAASMHMCCSLARVLVLVLVLVLVRPAAGYSLDVEHSLEFSGPPSSMFGYSVLLHRHRTHSWSDIYFINVIDLLSSC